MHRVAIIGAGQLGSRHLQGLARIDIPVEIIVVDPSKASLGVARNRFLEIHNRESVESVTYVGSLGEVPGKLDLAIVATTADIRGKVVKEVLDRGLTKKMVLEKVVFQSFSECEWARSLFFENGILCWVNCPRRTLDIYRRIKGLVSGEGKLFYSVYGGEWGLGCNAIHFVDQVFFLTGCRDYRMDVSGLDESVYGSKRKGFFEVSGLLRGVFANGSELLLYSHRTSAAPLMVAILAENHHVIIDEANGVARVSGKKVGWQWDEWRFMIPFQSEQTHIFVKDIVLTETCALTPFQESSEQHGPLLRALSDFFSLRIEIESGRCPIT